jgi:hypothetical protein
MFIFRMMMLILNMTDPLLVVVSRGRGTIAKMSTDFSDSNKSQSFSRYTDADRITEITGIAKYNFPKYCYGQPLDNARDSLENNYQISPMISTRLTRVRGKDNDSYDLLHLLFGAYFTSNPGNKVAFTLDRLKSAVYFEEVHERNIYWRSKLFYNTYRNW